MTHVGELSPIIITGAGCSGTGFISEVLNRVGISCGHENVVDPRVALRFAKPEWGHHAADASWLATFDAARYKVPVALQLRNPLSVALSYLNLGFYDLDTVGHAKYRAVVVARAPSIVAEPNEVDRVLRHIYESYTRARPIAAMVYNVEGLRPDTLVDLVGLGGRRAAIDEMPVVSTTINTHRRPELDEGPLVEAILASPWWRTIVEIYGVHYRDLPE